MNRRKNFIQEITRLNNFFPTFINNERNVKGWQFWQAGQTK